MVVAQVDLMSSPELLSIGVVARLTGRQPSAIRYYEEIGLLPAPLRVSGRRMYEPEVVRTLAVIETAQRAGLTLDEIGTLLETKAEDGESIGRLRAIARRKLPEVTALIQRTELVREWLACAERCECPSLDDCPLFDEPAPANVRDAH
jgi:MerR family transcriptional regulator, redox-sensitive transcriptional activator SoxR